MQNVTTVPYLEKKATPWVSSLVLVGCVLITVGLVYTTQNAYEIADGWSITDSAEY